MEKPVPSKRKRTPMVQNSSPTAEINMLMDGLTKIMQASDLSLQGKGQDDAVQRIEAMVKQEERYKTFNYLSPKKSLSKSSINKECRRRMCLWCYEIIDYYGLSRDTVYTAVSCLDRFVATPQGQCYIFDRTLYQLACVAALYFSIKTHESVEVKASMFVSLSHNEFTEVMITNAEQRMLMSLDWAVNPPSPKAYIREFVALLQEKIDPEMSQALLHLASYQAEVAVLNYKLSVLYRPCEVATACFLNALSLLLDDDNDIADHILGVIEDITGLCMFSTTMDRIRDMLLDQPSTEELSPICPDLSINKNKDCSTQYKESNENAKPYERKHMSPSTVA